MKTLLQIVLICFANSVLAQTLNLPPRATNAPSGSDFIRKISSLDFPRREQMVVEEVFAGNIPTFQRKFCPVNVTNTTDHTTNIATFFASPDYLAVGSDVDYFLTPISPNIAQHIADKLGCVLPTRKMTDAIYAAAEVKLVPSPIPPTAAMTTVPMFARINETVRAQRMALTNLFPLGALVAGDKKDVVISARLATATNKVAIYGWHQTNDVAIQPLYLGHTTAWVDYSHGIRFISQTILVNGEKTFVAEVLADRKLCGLISDEGVIKNARYPTNLGGTGFQPVVSGVPPETDGTRGLQPTASNNFTPPAPGEIRRDARFTNANWNAWPEKFSATTNFGEWTREIKLPDEVRIVINAPAKETFSPDKPVLLVFYALPNGNTIEQTIGKQLQPGDDWHYNIQHIGAQTRWLRQVITNKTIVVAYLEAGKLSWPAWRKTHNDQRIAEILDHVRGIFSANKTEVVLASHSGGGSLMFGYLNAVKQITDDVKRLAFLDSNYAYNRTNHADKLKNWLAAAPENRMCVLAYQDYLGLLDGKPFVSEAGGTWGRSQLMLEDLKQQFQFTSRTNAALKNFSALNGRVEFLLKENPEHKIFHTVQVERNGFIHALLSGTTDAGKGYEYFGERAYTHWIR